MADKYLMWDQFGVRSFGGEGPLYRLEFRKVTKWRGRTFVYWR